jgi:hypothetical protein
VKILFPEDALLDKDILLTVLLLIEFVNFNELRTHGQSWAAAGVKALTLKQMAIRS